MAKNQKMADLIYAYKLKVNQLTKVVHKYKASEEKYKNSLANAKKVISELKERQENVVKNTAAHATLNEEVKRMKEKNSLLIQDKEREINHLLHEKKRLEMQHEEKEELLNKQIAELTLNLKNSEELIQAEKNIITEIQSREGEFKAALSEKDAEIQKHLENEKQLSSQLDEAKSELDVLKESVNQKGEIIQILHQKEAGYEETVKNLENQIEMLKQNNIDQDKEKGLREQLEKEIQAMKKREQQKDQIIERFHQKEMKHQEELDEKKKALKKCRDQVDEKEKVLQEWESLEAEIAKLLEREEEYLKEVHRLSEALKATIQIEQHKKEILKLAENHPFPHDEETRGQKKSWFRFLKGWGSHREEEVFVRNK